jgi:hypothetical protein
MKVQLIYLIVITLLLIGSISVFWASFKSSKKSMNIRFKRNRYKEIKDTMKEQFENEEAETLFKDSGFFLSAFNYQIIRYSIICVWMIYLVFVKLNTNILMRNSAIFLLLFFICTSPRKEFLGRKSPLMRIMDYLKNEFKSKKNREVFRAISQLKNLSIVVATEALGSDFILEELKKYTLITRPIFDRMLSMWYEARHKEACDYFGEAIGTKEGRQLAEVFKKLDELEPSELKQEIILYQNTAREERKTEKNNKKETKGNWIFLLVTISALFVILNFLVVVISIDALNYYKGSITR